LRYWSKTPDLEHLIIDATIIRVHQHAAGAIVAGLSWLDVQFVTIRRPL